MGRKNFAFSLIELLIVVAAIGLLAVIVVSVLRGNILKGNDARRKSDLNRIKIALEEYEKDHNCYPPAEQMLKCGTDSDIAIHPYLSDVPCDPVTEEAYYYEPDPDSVVCVDWFRIYAELQNTRDSSVIIGIGLDAAYNYYARSENAPVITTGSTPVPSTAPSSGPQATPTQTPNVYYWGCINGACQPAPLNSNGQPICSPVFDNAQCNGNPCSGTGAPICVTQSTPSPMPQPHGGPVSPSL